MEEVDEKTLKEYIDENDKLLSVLGVFSALTLFFNGNADNNFTKALAVLSLFLTFLIWMEVWINFPRKNNSLILGQFGIILTGSSIIFTFYILTEIYNISSTLFTLTTGSIIFVITLYIVSKLKVFNYLSEGSSKRVKNIKIGIGILFLCGIIINSTLVAVIISPYLIKFLNALNSDSGFLLF